MSSRRGSLSLFEYPAIGGGSTDPVGPLGIELPLQPDPGAARQREEAARDEGLREGHDRAHREYEQAYEQALGRERRAIAAALERFQAEQTRYRDRAEAEVVRLAVTIARRILGREAQLDPLLLAGTVRVALGQLPRESARLRVAPAAAERWRALLADLESPPEIVADGAIVEPDCVIESKLGEVELSLDRQIDEIERGLERLLCPAATAGER